MMIVQQQQLLQVTLVLQHCPLQQGPQALQYLQYNVLLNILEIHFVMITITTLSATMMGETVVDLMSKQIIAPNAYA